MAKYLKIDSVLNGVVERLCAPESYMGVYHQPSFGSPMPSVELLSEIVERLRSVLFPGFSRNPSSLRKTWPILSVPSWKKSGVN